MINQDSFFENVDPKKKPDRPESIAEDYEDYLEEDCLYCGKQFGIHTTRDIVLCAINQLKGGIPKG